MALGAWIVESKVIFGSWLAYTAQLGATAAAQQRVAITAAEMQGKLSPLEGKMLRNAAAADAVAVSYSRMRIAAVGALAAIGAGVTVYGVKSAADLQRSLTAVQIATNNFTPKAFQQYSRLALQTSGITAQDVGTIASEMAMAASSGLNDPKKLNDAFTRIAKAADVLWMSPKHIDPVAATQQMSTLAHLFGRYSGPGFQHMLDRATEMMFVQPEALQKLVTQGRVFMPSAMSAGVSEEDIFKQAMTMGQTGFLSGRGGSGLARMIEYLSGATSMTGHLSKAQRKAMGVHGLDIEDANGTLRREFLGPHGELLLGKVVDHLEAIRGKFSPTEWTSLLTNAFLAQGGRYASDITLPNIYKKAQENWAMMQKMGGVDDMWKKYSDNFLYQFSVFVTNFKNLFIVIFQPTLKPLTTMFEAMGTALGKLVLWLADHQDWAGALAAGIMLITGAATTATVLSLTLKWFTLIGAMKATDAAAAETTTAFSLMRTGLLALATNPVIVALLAGLALTSGNVGHDEARKNLVEKYGYGYWKYLKGRHPGEDPYSFDTSSGDMSPQAWMHAHAPKNHPLSRPPGKSMADTVGLWDPLFFLGNASPIKGLATLTEKAINAGKHLDNHADKTQKLAHNTDAASEAVRKFALALADAITSFDKSAGQAILSVLQQNTVTHKNIPKTLSVTR